MTGTTDYEALIPEIPIGPSIPKIIHQVYAYPHAMPEHLVRKIDEMRRVNPAWEHRVYDTAAMEAFIERHYGREVLARFRRIGPNFGAARADLFRYLAIYRCGGVYLDIKSTFTRPIDEVIDGSEGFVVSHWDNGPGEEHEGWGIHPELDRQPRGEMQQWHVIAAAGHPYLRRTLVNLLARIDRYRPWRHHVGWLGVLNLTGPIAYTQDIAPILGAHPHKVLRDQRDIGLRYTVFSEDEHKNLSKGHYVARHEPVVRLPGLLGVLSNGYALARQWKRRWAGKDNASR